MYVHNHTMMRKAQDAATDGKHVPPKFTVKLSDFLSTEQPPYDGSSGSYVLVNMAFTHGYTERDEIGLFVSAENLPAFVMELESTVTELRQMMAHYDEVKRATDK